MKNKILIITLFCLLFLSNFLVAQTNKSIIERVEPRNWWIGMNTPLQLMLHGTNIANADIVSLDNNFIIKNIIKTDNPNYVFLDIIFAENAKTGNYSLQITLNKKKIVYEYPVLERRKLSAQRKSFDASDLIYLLMPDRFANGNEGNDNFQDMPDKCNRSKDGSRHGGDIQGIIEHLDYISELGATALWATPLTVDNEKAASYHGYACGDYYLTDPRYGSNEDYKNLVETAHSKHLKVIMDMVPNHCGTAHWWMHDLPCSDWVNQFPQFTRSSFQMATQSSTYTSEKDLHDCIDGWFDYTMPDMNLGNPLVVQYLAQMAVWWIEYADLDGLRVDTYPYSDKFGLQKWAKTILEEYPNLNITTETWFHNVPMIAYWQGGAKNKDGYDALAPTPMDFVFNDNLMAAINEEDNREWGKGMFKLYEGLSQDFIYENPNSLLIFADNHDMRRLFWQFGGDKDKVKRAYTILATMRGIPQIYYGDEILMQNKERQGDIHERIDMSGGWKGDSRNVFTKEGRTDDENEVFDYISKIFNWRKTSSAVHYGKMMQFVPADNLYIYFRYDDSECVMTIINNTSKEQKIDAKKYKEILSKYSEHGYSVVNSSLVQPTDYKISGKKADIIVFGK